MVDGTEIAESMLDHAEFAAHTEFHALGYHLIKRRIGEEGVWQPAFEFDVVRIVTTGNRRRPDTLEDLIVARQFYRRRRARRFAVIGVDTVVLG